MNHIQNFVKSRLKTYSQETEACPVCHSTPCTCSQVATMSEDKLLDEVKTDLVALVTANAGDIDTAEAIDVIKSATKDDLVDMIAEEIEDQGKEESLATYIEGLSKAKDKLSGNCGEMKTHSAMAELDLQFKGDLDALLKRYESSVENLPKFGGDETAEEFWKKCIKWADDVEKNPEPALYNELVALGKKYNVDVK